MARKIVKLTPAQIEAIRDSKDWFEAISGGMDDVAEKEVKRYIKHLKNILTENSLPL